MAKYATTPPDISHMPPGVPYIVGNEAAERFSFYGMRAILVIFMTKYLQDAAGNEAPMTDQRAQLWYHAFVFAVYFFPIVGAIISDLLWGKYRTIMVLSVVYCLGHLCLAIDDTRFWMFSGLFLIAFGAGGIKPCVSAHVGDQFGKRNQNLLNKIFGWFYFAINFGATTSSLLTPLLLEKFGPSVAFGVPGVLMALATWFFWLGRKKFVHIPAAGKKSLEEALSGEGLQAIKNLSKLYVFVAVFWALFDQTGSSWVLQARRMNREWLGYEWLPSQIQAINPLLVMAFIPLFTYIVYPVMNRIVPLTPLRKIGMGLFLTAVAFSVPAWIASQISGGEVRSVSSEGDKDQWPAENLISDLPDGEGWVSRTIESATESAASSSQSGIEASGTAEQYTSEGAKTPVPLQEIVLRLRERRAWPIEKVRIYPAARIRRFLTESFLKEHPAYNETLIDPLEAERACWAKEVEVLAGPAPVGPWGQSLGRIILEQSETFQELDFDPVETEYLLLRIHSNWGGDRVALGKVEVHAAGELPVDAHKQAAAVWPNVCATGFRPSIVWQLLAYVIMTAAEIMVSVTCLEFSYTQAPKKMKSFIMSLYMLSVSVGNLLPLAVNWFIQNDDKTTKLEGPAYYWFFTSVMFVAAAIFVMVARNYRGQTYIQGDEMPHVPDDKIRAEATGQGP